jgi:hypothetical protein
MKMEERELGYCAFRPRIKIPFVAEENLDLAIDILQLPPEMFLKYISNNLAFFEELFVEDTEDK